MPKQTSFPRFTIVLMILLCVGGMLGGFGWVTAVAAPATAAPILQSITTQANPSALTEENGREGTSSQDTQQPDAIEAPPQLTAVSPENTQALSTADIAALASGGGGLPCNTEYTGDNVTDFISPDAGAVQAAIGAAGSGSTIKIAGTCAGVQTIDGNTQTAYITQSLTLQGGYTTTNWLAASDPETYPTTLDAQSAGRVVYINAGLDVTLDGLTLTGGLSGNGGGIFLTASTLTVSHSAITTNATTGDGGAIFTQDNCTLTLLNTVLSNNTAASDGGGILGNDFCTITIDSSTLSGNTATNDYGGSIFMDDNSDLTVVNSTFSGNTANDGGGAFADDVGAASVFSYTTIVSNTAANGGGGLDLWGSTAEFASSILAYNATGGNPNNVATGNGAVITSQGYNLEDRNDAGFSGTGDLINTDPLLDPLADNGGDTQTHALLPASIAINLIPPGTNGCGTSIPTDQRGYVRPFDTGCDMGAFEYLTALLVAYGDVYTTTEDVPLTIATPGVLGNDYDANGDVLTATLLTAPADGTLVLASDGSFTYTPDPNFNGVDTFTYAAVDGVPTVQGYWPFEDGSNPTVDESGNGYDGTLVNGTTFVSTTPVTLTNSSMALSFDGTDDRVDVPGPINLANESFTVSFWAKRNALSGNTDIVFGQGTGGTNVVLHIGFRNTNVFTCAFWNNDLNTPVAYTDLNWHHWACTYDATTNQRAIYRDGVLVASDTASADYQGSGTVGIGHRNNGDHFNGLLDDVRLYYGALSVAEVQAAMPGEMPGLGDTAVVTLNVTPVNDPPIAVDDAYTTPQGTALVRDVTPGNLATTFAHNNSLDGNMFDVTAGTRDVHITAMDIHVDATGSREVAVYYKAGTYAGSEQTPGAWTLLGTQFVDAQGTGNVTSLDLTPLGGLTIPANQTYGLYVTVTDTSISLRYINGANTYSNGDLTITTGTGNAYPFGSVFSPRTWNGTIYYEVTAGVLYNDSEVDGESLTASLSTGAGNGVLTFNSDGSFVYTPTISFFGVDTFTYIASDGALTDTATVSITVTALPCQVEATGDNLTDYASADESALQNAVNNANPGNTLKVAGTCAGTHLQGGETQTVYISQTLTIQGGYTATNWLAAPDPEAYPTTLDAQDGGRVAYIPAGLNVTLDGLILTGGLNGTNGGGLYNAGTALIANTTFTRNTAVGSGGGLYNSGILTVTNTTIFSNTSGQFGGGIEHQSGSLALLNSQVLSNTAGSDGGGIDIWSGTASTIANSTILGNQSAGGDGGGIYNNGDTAVISSTLSDNTSNLSGGGIYNSGVLTVTGTTLFSNTSGEFGGGIENENGVLTVLNTQILSNTADFDGGGIDTWDGSVPTVINSTIQGNQSVGGYGGGIWNEDDLTLLNSTIRNNSTSLDGGGLWNSGNLVLTNSTLTGNQAENGGGLWNGGAVDALNSTVSGNTALGNGGGILHDVGSGGELLRPGGRIHSLPTPETLSLNQTTIVSNTADLGNNGGDGGGLHLISGTLLISNTVLVSNLDVSSAGADDCSLAGGTAVSGGYNLLGIGTGCTFAIGSDLSTDNPLLGSLADNGGDTPTHLPLPFSPAIDTIPAGTNGCGTTITTDQRGFGRPVDAACDTGAVELETNHVPVATGEAYTTTEDITLTVTAPGVLTNDVDGDWDSLTAVLDTDVTSGTLTLNSDGSFDYTPDANFCGTDSFTYRANDGQDNSNTATVALSVTCVNDTPTAADDAYTTSEDTPLNVAAPGVLGNDDDGDGDNLTAVLDTTVTTGTLTFNSDGSFNYTPPANWFGVVTFTYHANDGQVDSNSATVTLTVLSENDLPVVDAGSDQTADEGEVVSFNGSYIDPGLQGSVPSIQYPVFSTQYSVASSPMGGISIHWDFGDGTTATGSLTPTHVYGDDGVYTVTLTITDTEGGVNSDSLLVTVANVAPTLTALPDQSVTAGSVVTFTTLFTDPGVLDTHTAVIDWGDGTVEAGTVDQLAMSVSGSHSYTNSGLYIVTVTLTDDEGGETSTTFTVTVGSSGYVLFLPIVIR